MNWIEVNYISILFDTMYTEYKGCTKIDGIKIDNVKGRKASTKEGIVAYRTRGNNFLEAFQKDRTIGNPWNSRGFGLLMTKSVIQSVYNFSIWLMGIAHEDVLQDYRNEIVKNRDKIKEMDIIYYKDIGQPSHATALRIIIDKELIWKL